ncbi:hypothetical protein [Kitasatospora sp. NPDC101183]|uniref:hypothetical protein n=1 Tax=Kitasatospora sp. NPDC101183 TaxID=3364100 RepID=UPI00382DCDE7
MGRRQIAPPAGESRLIVLLAVLSCVPVVVKSHTGYAPPHAAYVIIEIAVGFLATLPLLMPSSAEFRAVTLTCGWLILGGEILVSAPFLLLPLVIFVPALPAGVLLLIAARRDAPITRLAIAAGITAVPYVWLFSWIA